MAEMLGKREYESASCNIRYSQALPMSLRDSIREVHDLKTDKGMRGKGQGSRLMESVCKEADKAQMMLMLLADNEKLELWYNRFGFETLEKSDKFLMFRKPTVK